MHNALHIQLLAKIYFKKNTLYVFYSSDLPRIIELRPGTV